MKNTVLNNVYSTYKICKKCFSAFWLSAKNNFFNSLMNFGDMQMAFIKFIFNINNIINFK